MDKDSAKNLIQNALQSSFNKELFVYLVKNILKHIEEAPFVYTGNLIFEDFADSIKTVERIGKYKDPEGKLIDILIVQLQREASLERARTKQRNFVAKYLKGSRGGVLKDAALAAFVSPNGDDWRFSLVKMEYKFNEKGKVEEEFPPARRYSFLVGKNENSHTAQSRLLPLLLNDETNPSLEELEDVFSVEKVTKEFFEKYRDLFLRLKESLDDIVKRDPKIKADFKEKNVDTADFAKKLLGQIVFLYFLQKKGWFGVPRGKDWGEGDKKFLRNLFDNAKKENKNYFNRFLEPLFYEALRLERPKDYYDQFNCRIPFLNDGLFDPVNDYDWQDTDIEIPNDIFSNNRKTKEGDTGDGILDIFDRYNFTVKEDEPLEKEVAIDPEMLGKVFENLLEVKDRKSKGTYYTPREIVHYMCQESLANYLSTELEGKVCKEEIETLIKYGESVVEHDSRVLNEGRETRDYSFKLPPSVRKHAQLIDEKLKTIRVCDPAVGSGAFPVGMMNEIIRTRNALTPYIGENGERSPYHFKRQAIQNCLYGVDIDPGAVEIAKLRLWLSLIVDEEDIKQIKPLPNLDYKIVQGNSLLSVEKNLFNYDLFSKLEELKPLYFNETSASKKQEYRKQIDELISQITNGHKDFDFEVYFSEVFHEKKGFDVVIANPPYLSHDKIREKKIIAGKFRAYEPFADLYCYFLEIALNLQNEKGLLCCITSNSYLKAEYGRPLRNLLLEEDYVLAIINIEDFQVFDAAIVNTAVIIAQHHRKTEFPKCLIVNSSYDGKAPFESFLESNKFFYSQDDFRGRSWYLLSPQQLSLKRKMEHAGKTLEMYGTKIRLGIATGANEVFLIDEERKNELIKKDPLNARIIKPVLRGRDIFRYKYQFDNKYIILTANGINVRKEYPEIYKYFDSFGDAFKKRGAKGEHWSNLRPTAFLDDFKKEKIVWIELTDKGRFTLCSEEIYLLNSAYFLIPPQQFSAKYLLALLNSKPIEFYLGCIAETSGMGVTRWINNYVKDFHVPEIPLTTQKPFIDLVDQILAITKDDDYLENPAKQAKVREYEKQIDQLVYELYGLTPEEIKIVEGQNDDSKS